jgi:fructose-specific phosphotransferase system IIC component
MENQPNPDQPLTAWQRFWGGTAIGLIGLAFAALYCYGVADAPWPVAGWLLGVGSCSLLGLLAVGLKADPRRMLNALLDSLPG